MLKKFEHIVGNEKAKEYLTRIVAKGTIPQSLLFTGPNDIGKGLFAEAFANLVLKIDPNRKSRHPDLHIYRPEGKLGMHSIDSLRQFGEEVNLPPFEAKRKICIIDDAERMLPYSSNALLKTFEEPAAHSIIILVTSNPEALLSTVLSRCSIVRFQSLSPEERAKVLEENPLKQQEDPLRNRILQWLAKGKNFSYVQLIDEAQQMAELIEQQQIQLEEETREAIKKDYPDGVANAQLHPIEKEIEGALALQLSRKTQELFIYILGWYRDMQLLHVNGNVNYLFHSVWQTEINQSLQRGELLPIEQVQKAIKQAELGLARSTPLSSCLEHLLLQLK